MINGLTLASLSNIQSPLNVAAVFDLKTLRIPNVLSIVGIGIFLLTMPLLPLNEIGFRALASLVVFCLGLTAFAFGLVGGGDVKLLSVLLLVVPSAAWLLFTNAFAWSLLVGLVVFMSWQRVPRFQSVRFRASTEVGHFAMGPSIAMAGIGTLFSLAL